MSALFSIVGPTAVSAVLATAVFVDSPAAVMHTAPAAAMHTAPAVVMHTAPATAMHTAADECTSICWEEFVCPPNEHSNVLDSTEAAAHLGEPHICSPGSGEDGGCDSEWHQCEPHFAVANPSDVRHAIRAGDIAALIRQIASHPNSIHVNYGRELVQIVSCRGEVIAQTPLPTAIGEKLAASLQP